MAHEAKRGPRPLILKCERRQWKKENGIPLRSGPRMRPGQVRPEGVTATLNQYFLDKGSRKLFGRRAPAATDS